MNPPSPEEIVALADELGYKEFRSQVSCTLFLVQTHAEVGSTPIRIHIYYTTRSIMTHLDHPKTGPNRLWRSAAYASLEELRTLLEDPRTHTQLGYRKASQAVRVCVECQVLLPRKAFSLNQWAERGPDLNRCKERVNGTTKKKKQEQTKDAELAELTADKLQLHNRQQRPSKKKHNIIQDRRERRQFNCPKQGRGRFLFFKKVPVTKPIVKCPQCKRASNDSDCPRLYPVEQAKGYGLFLCHVCSDKWGSSRAVHNVSQECHNCKLQGKNTMVLPFRLEVPHGRKRQGGRRPRRVPVETIGEDAVEQSAYGTADEDRNVTAAGNALVRRTGEGRSYAYQPQESASETSSLTHDESWTLVEPRNKRIPQGYQHSCAACATGGCRNRRVSLSHVVDVHDGNTVSTSASVVTNSSIDKSDFYDRDEDFEGFEDNWKPEE